MKSLLAVIPARWQSSRFPGKPLAVLEGKPVIQRVFERVKQVIDADSIVVATDDERISNACKGFGARAVMTSPSCLTGTDRVAEVAESVSANWFLNIQGDEPFVDPEAIKAVMQWTRSKDRSVAINAIAPLETEDDFRSFTVPKVVVNQKGDILYLSRSPIPISKSGGFSKGFRQVGLYAFSREALACYGVDRSKSTLEEIEDIEILRLIELGYSVRSVVVPSPGPAIDTPGDLERARLLLQGRSAS